MVALLCLYYSDCCKFSSSKTFSEKSHVQRGRDLRSNCWMSFSWVKFFAFVQISWVRHSRLKRHWDVQSTKPKHAVLLYTNLRFLRQHQYMQNLQSWHSKPKVFWKGTISQTVWLHGTWILLWLVEDSHSLEDFQMHGWLWQMVPTNFINTLKLYSNMQWTFNEE